MVYNNTSSSLRGKVYRWYVTIVYSTYNCLDPTQWRKITGDTEQCYRLTPAYDSATNAATDCTSNGGTLASINTLTHLQDLQRSLQLSFVSLVRVYRRVCTVYAGTVGCE